MIGQLTKKEEKEENRKKKTLRFESTIFDIPEK